MAPRPSSPTSLLWAHQLKREHGHLLQRIQNLESKNDSHDSRLKAAESATATTPNPEIEVLAEQVKPLNEAGVEKRIADMEKSVAEQLDDVQAESEAHTIQMATLQQDAQMAEDERRKAAGKDKLLLKRIEEVEAHLNKYEKSLGKIGKRPDETRFGQIKGQLDGLTKEVKQEGEQMKWLQESITALESANAELLKANEKLDREISKMAAKQAANEQKKKAEKSTSSTVQHDSQAIAGAEDDDTPRKKSHKWVGGGADRDIIRLGSGFFTNKPKAAQRPPQSTVKESSIREQPKKVPAPPGPKKKPQPPALKPQRFVPSDASGTPKKSHRWAGGGADKDIIQSGVSTSVDGKRKRVSDVVEEASRRKPQRFSEGDADGDTIRAGPSSSARAQPSHMTKVKSEFVKPPRRSIPQAEGDEVVVRSGKGWLEVIEGDVDENFEPPPPVKRKRGRPRKDEVAPPVTEEELTLGRGARRGVQQPQAQSVGAPVSLVEEMLGDLQHTETAQEIVYREPSISRAKLEHLKEILTRNPKARTDVREVGKELDGVSVVEQVLGDLQHTKTAQEIVRTEPSISREKLERLKGILERNPKAKTDFDELLKEANAKPSAKRKRTAGSTFGSDDDDDEAANRGRIKRIKREESPEGSTADALHRIPKVYRSPSRSQPGSMAAAVSQSSEAPRKPRRQIAQPDDISTS